MVFLKTVKRFARVCAWLGTEKNPIRPWQGKLTVGQAVLSCLGLTWHIKEPNLSMAKVLDSRSKLEPSAHLCTATYMIGVYVDHDVKHSPPPPPPPQTLWIKTLCPELKYTQSPTSIVSDKIYPCID